MTEENTGVSLTLKGGSGYEAPWIVIHGLDVAGAGAMLAELVDSEIPRLLAFGAKAFQAEVKGAVVPPLAIKTEENIANLNPSPPDELLKEHLGATEVPGNAEPPAMVVEAGGAVPREITFCDLHNEERKYFAPGVSSKTGNPYNASYRCSQRGCAAKPPKPMSLWQREDGKWLEKKWVKR